MTTDGTELEFALKAAIERVWQEQDVDIVAMSVVQTSALANTIATIGVRLGTHSQDEALQAIPGIRKRLEAAVDAELERLTRTAERN